MQFLVLAHDGGDEGALNRRLAAREAHLALGDRMRAAGEMLYGAAILDDSGRMVGSALVMDFPSRRDLDRWLEGEPYVLGKVWERIEVRPCKVGEAFAPKAG